MARERPIGVTTLAILACIGVINTAIYTLQMLHLLPTYVGPVAFWQVSLMGAFLWCFLTLIRLSVAGMLLQLHPQGYTSC